MKPYRLAVIFFLSLTHSAFSQGTDNVYLPWSSTRRLTINDFEIKSVVSHPNASFAQFTLNYTVNGFDFLTNNFNKKVTNYFIKSASWIDTTTHVNSSLTYQQTLFDLAEIYARRFRKQLKINRRKIAFGTDFIHKINADITTEHSKRRVLYDTETNFGLHTVAQKQWEMAIQNELNELSEFASEP